MKGPEYFKGQAKAAKDIAAGKMVFLDNVGVIGPGTEEQRRVLKRDFGMGYRFDGSLDCGFVDGYNEQVDREARRRFGEDYAVRDIEAQNSQFGRLPVGPR